MNMCSTRQGLSGDTYLTYVATDFRGLPVRRRVR